MVIKKNEQLIFYDGQIHSIDKERMAKFDKKVFLDRYFPNQDVTTNDLLDELGTFAIDYTNLHSWFQEIPDIDDRSTRLFTIWAEDIHTKEVIAIVKGYIILHPFNLSKSSIEEYYFGNTEVPYYPKVLITTFRTVLKETKELNNLIVQLSDAIEIKWQLIRERVISSSVDTEIRKRFILSFKTIIHYSYIIPSVEQDLIKALKRRDYLISGVMQVLSLKSASYEEALISHHVEEAKRLFLTFPNNKD